MVSDMHISRHTRVPVPAATCSDTYFTRRHLKTVIGDGEGSAELGSAAAVAPQKPYLPGLEAAYGVLSQRRTGGATSRRTGSVSDRAASAECRLRPALPSANDLVGLAPNGSPRAHASCYVRILESITTEQDTAIGAGKESPHSTFAVSWRTIAAFEEVDNLRNDRQQVALFGMVLGLLLAKGNRIVPQAVAVGPAATSGPLLANHLVRLATGRTFGSRLHGIRRRLTTTAASSRPGGRSVCAELANPVGSRSHMIARATLAGAARRSEATTTPWWWRRSTDPSPIHSFGVMSPRRRSTHAVRDRAMSQIFLAFAGRLNRQAARPALRTSLTGREPSETKPGIPVRRRRPDYSRLL